MGKEDNPRQIRVVGNYPRHIVYQKVDYLDLKKGNTVFALEPQDYEVLMFLGNFFANIKIMSSESVMEMLTKIPSHIIFNTEQPDQVIFKGCKFPFIAVSAIALNTNNPTNFEKYLLIKSKGTEKLYYNYGGNFYDYYGVGITELTKSWRIICDMCRIRTYCMFVLTDKIIKHENIS